MLTRIEHRSVRVGATRHGLAIGIGFALVAIGGLYGVWGVKQLDPKRAPDPAAGFDRPIARIAAVFDSRPELEEIETESPLEKKLLDRVIVAEGLVIRLIQGLFRILLSTLVLGSGMALLAWGVAARNFGRLLEKLVAEGNVAQPEA